MSDREGKKERSFNANPERCPDCGTSMLPTVTYGSRAEKAWRTLRRDFRLCRGYFRPRGRGP